MKMKKTHPASACSLPEFRWQELVFAGAMTLSPYLLAWLVLAVTQA